MRKSSVGGGGPKPPPGKHAAASASAASASVAPAFAAQWSLLDDIALASAIEAAANELSLLPSALEIDYRYAVEAPLFSKRDSAASGRGSKPSSRAGSRRNSRMAAAKGKKRRKSSGGTSLGGVAAAAAAAASDAAIAGGTGAGSTGTSNQSDSGSAQRSGSPNESSKVSAQPPAAAPVPAASSSSSASGGQSSKPPSKPGSGSAAASPAPSPPLGPRKSSAASSGVPRDDDTSSSNSLPAPCPEFISPHLAKLLATDALGKLRGRRAVPHSRSWPGFVCERALALIALNKDVRALVPFVNLRTRESNVLHDFLAWRRQLLFEHTKLDYLHYVLDETATEQRETFLISIDRLSASVASRQELSVFGQGFRQLANVSPLALRTPFTLPPGGKPSTPFEVVFESEKVVGFDGPYRAFFSDICRELQAIDDESTADLFVKTPNHTSSVGANRELYTIAPRSTSLAHLDQFHFLGRLMGVALRTSVLLALDLPQLFWRLFIGRGVDTEPAPSVAAHASHGRVGQAAAAAAAAHEWSSLFSEIDLNFVDGLIKPLTECATEDEFKARFGTSLDFSVGLSDGSVKPLGGGSSDGAESRVVTFENRLEFVRLAKDARLNEFRVQVNAMREGFGTVVPLEALSLFTAQEVRRCICGQPKVDLELLKRHTRYGGSLSADSPLIKNLWTVLEEFSEENRRKLVQFVYAQQHLPSETEFKRRHLRLLVQELKSKKEPDRMLPHASTCFFNLSLPMYTTIDALRSNLLIAITSAPGFGTDEEERQLAQIAR